MATLVDPDTGARRESGEPLRTLKTFRQHAVERKLIRRVVGEAARPVPDRLLQVGESPLFGMHYSLLRPGQVRLQLHPAWAGLVVAGLGGRRCLGAEDRGHHRPGAGRHPASHLVVCLVVIIHRIP